MESLDEIVPEDGYTARRRPGRLVGQLREMELHVIGDVIKFPDHVKHLFSHFGGLSIHLKL